MKIWGISILAILAMSLLTSCESTGNESRMIAERQAQIAAEPPGDYWIGRRYHIPYTQFWGYVRRPGKSWDTARLVVMVEDRKLSPDRIPEEGAGIKVHGYDHNYEYRLTGHLTSELIYDPNSDQELPGFVLTGYELLRPNAGFIFSPKESKDRRYLPRREPTTRSGLR